MLTWGKPDRQDIERFLADNQSSRWSYEEVGATRNRPPEGYDVDYNRVLLGAGEAAYRRARAALCRWEMFNLGWVQIQSELTSEAGVAEPEEGMTVAMIASYAGLWFTSACRIVYLFDHEGSPTRFGFAYGTLADHVEIGEERFTVEWDREDGRVWYEILAFSRPRHLLARLGYPLVRRLQRRFAAESMAVMKSAVARPGSAE